MNQYSITCFFDKNIVQQFEISAYTEDHAYEVLMSEHDICPNNVYIEMIS